MGAIVVPARQWNEVLDALVAFRSRLSHDHGFRMRNELHATDFPSGAGSWYGLKAGPRQRWGVYKAALAVLRELAPVVQAYGIVVPDLHDRRLRVPGRDLAWTVLLERLERYTIKQDSMAMLIADSGQQLAVRRLSRQRRRYGPVPSAFGPGYLARPFERLLEDPWFRASEESYFLQWADLVAYAAFRTVLPRAPQVPPDLWSELGDVAVLREVNELERRARRSNERPGLIVLPGRAMPRPPE